MRMGGRVNTNNILKTLSVKGQLIREKLKTFLISLLLILYMRHVYVNY